MSAVFSAAAIIFLGGCSGSSLERAIKSENFELMRLEVQEKNLTSSDSYKENKSKNLKEAEGMLSDRYYRKYTYSNNKLSLSEFDSYCFSYINAACSEPFREKIKAAEIKQNIKNRKNEKEREYSSSQAQSSPIRKIEKSLKPGDGSRLLSSPDLTGGDGNYYKVVLVVTDFRDGKIISWFPDFQGSSSMRMPRMGAVVKPIRLPEKLPFGSRLVVIGKYTENERFQLSNGRSVVVPVFEDAYLFQDN